MLSTSSAIDPGHPYRPENTLEESPNMQYKRINSSKYKTYLCDYQFKGKTWSVQLKATSFNEAEERVQALSKGKIVGELMLTIPFPVKDSWVQAFLKRLKKLS